MERGSKHNPYRCPQCDYLSSRKYNLAVHMERVHGLNLPSYLYKSQKDWVWAQRAVLQRAYVEKAETEREKPEAWTRLYNFLVIWGRKGYWDFTRDMPEVLKARAKREEKSQE